MASLNRDFKAYDINWSYFERLKKLINIWPAHVYARRMYLPYKEYWSAVRGESGKRDVADAASEEVNVYALT